MAHRGRGSGSRAGQHVDPVRIGGKYLLFHRGNPTGHLCCDWVFCTSTRPSHLDGHFRRCFVYRRRAKPGAVSNESFLIRYIKSIKDNGDKTATAELTFYSKDKTEVMPCTITVVNNQIEIKSGEHSWLMFVYKIEKDELIFGDHKTLLYYAKAL